MFNSILTIGKSLGTQSDPDSIEDIDPLFTAPLPDTSELLAAAGMPAHAIREVLGSRTHTGADGSIEEEEGFQRVTGEGIERDRFPFADPMS